MSHNSKYYTKKLKSKDGRKCQKITTFLKPEPKADDDHVAPELAITDTVSVSVDLASDIDITAEKCSSESNKYEDSSPINISISNESDNIISEQSETENTCTTKNVESNS